AARAAAAAGGGARRGGAAPRGPPRAPPRPPGAAGIASRAGGGPSGTTTALVIVASGNVRLVRLSQGAAAAAPRSRNATPIMWPPSRRGRHPRGGAETHSEKRTSPYHTLPMIDPVARSGGRSLSLVHLLLMHTRAADVSDRES